jgi:hypothetical protein
VPYAPKVEATGNNNNNNNNNNNKYLAWKLKAEFLDLAHHSVCFHIFVSVAAQFENPVAHKYALMKAASRQIASLEKDFCL